MSKTLNIILSFFLASILALGVGCAKKADDGKISAEIQNKFSQDSGLSGKELTVQADHGVVTLAGTVDNDAQRQAASKQAASVEGVKQVLNNLQVRAANTSAPAAPAPEMSDSNKPARGSAHAERDSKRNRPHTRRNSDAHENASADANGNSRTANNLAPTPAPSDSAPAQAPPPPPPAPKRLIIDQGTQLAVRLVDPIDSEKNQTGDAFHATLNAPLTSDGEEAVPAGSDVTGHLVEVKSAGKFAGQSSVVLQLDSISSGGKTYTVQTDQYRKQGSSRGKNTAEKVGGGAIVGGIIGAIAGGGKGAAIGSAAGAGVGGGVQAATKSQQIKLPSETILNFTLQAPITVVQVSNPNASRPRLGDSPQQ